MESYNANAARRLDESNANIIRPVPKKEQVKISQVNEHELLHTQRPQIMKKVSVIVAIVAILSYVLYLRVVQSEVDNTYSLVQKELSELNSEQVRMQMALEELTGTENFESEVVNTYGLQKMNEEQVTYVDLEGKNKIVIPKK